MRFVIVVCIMLILGVGQVRPETISRLDLDEASTIGFKIGTDTKIKVEGKASVRITTLWPTLVCLGEVPCRAENGKLFFQARIRTQLEGDAFLEMWVHIGGGKYFSRGLNDRAQGRTEWKTIQTPFTLQKGQQVEKATLNLVINGIGVVWIDDVTLRLEHPPVTGLSAPATETLKKNNP
jgi:hypothetical protein